MAITREYVRSELPNQIRDGHCLLDENIYTALYAFAISDGREDGENDLTEAVKEAFLDVGHPEEYDKYLNWVSRQQLAQYESSRSIAKNVQQDRYPVTTENGIIKPGQNKSAFIPIVPLSASVLDGMDIKPVQWIVKDLLPVGLSMLSSPPKYYKSFLALDLCASVCTGNSFLGFKTEKHGCLYFDLESTPRRPRDRLNLIMGDVPKPDNLHFITADMRPGRIGKGFIEQLEYQVCNLEDIALVVIDVYQKIRSPGSRGQSIYDKDYADSDQLKAIADKYEICILLIHHNRKMKDGADVFNEMSGSTGVLGSLDNAWVISKSSRNDDDAVLYTTGRDVESRELCIRFNKDRFKWQYEGTPEDIESTRREGEYLSSGIPKAIRQAVENEDGYWIGSAKQLAEYARENSIVIHESYSGIGKFFDEHVREFWNIDRIDCERLSRNNKGQPWRFTKSVD